MKLHLMEAFGKHYGLTNSKEIMHLLVIKMYQNFSCHQ